MKNNLNEVNKDLEILHAIKILYEHCKDHPTCEKCQFWAVHKGCAFRYGTPREWFG